MHISAFCGIWCLIGGKMDPLSMLIFIGILVAGIAAVYFIALKKAKSQPSNILNVPQTPQQEVKIDVSQNAVVLEAKAKAQEIVLDAKREAMNIEAAAEEKARKTREKTVELEKDVALKRAEVEAKERDLASKAKSVKEIKERLERQRDELDELTRSHQSQLEKIAAMSKEDAKKMLLESLDKELIGEKGKKIKQMEEEVRKEADERAREILLDAMRFGSTDYVVEYTTSRVKIGEDDMKGRIIGKEGRNIKLFEELTGVELDLDASPGEVIVSCFDPVRREIAKVALERLLKDGRIQPSRIEEVVEQTTKEIEQIIYKEGDNLCHKVGVYDLPKEIVQMLGRFKYRFSYGQNMIEHTLEETRIGVAIASELGADVRVVKVGCLLHDIGKVVNDEEGTHVQLGVELLKKYKVDEAIINCVAEHHEDRPFSSIESSIVNLADHISGARPGARSEDYDAYVKRMKALEDAAKSFDGIFKAYAISAGREVRVYVVPEKVDDPSTAFLAREIARKIELEQTYPGVVKVTVIRETRVSETAK